MQLHRVVRTAEQAYATVQASLACFVLGALSSGGIPIPGTVLAFAWLPAVAALALDLVLRPGSRWPWWVAAVLASYVLLDSVIFLVRVPAYASTGWPGGAWVGVGLVGVKLLTQLVVVVMLALAMRGRV